jgi:hypothetical protein
MKIVPDIKIIINKYIKKFLDLFRAKRQLNIGHFYQPWANERISKGFKRPKDVNRTYFT